MRLTDGAVADAEIHWFEAHGIGPPTASYLCLESRRSLQDRSMRKVVAPAVVIATTFVLSGLASASTGWSSSRGAEVASDPGRPLDVSGAAATLALAGPPTLAGCPMFPEDNIWNWPVDDLPLHPMSDTYVATIGRDGHVHADFGSGLWNGGPIGIPFVVVPGTQPKVPVSFEYEDESDPGPYPIPPDAPIEGGPESDGDRHIIVVDKDACVLYETWSTYPNPDGSWRAGSGARFDLRDHALRPDTWTSADAAGLPILNGLVRYDEVAAGEIRHAIRFTVPQTQRAYLWPARHFASHLVDERYPPMGLRMRLKSDFDDSDFSPEAQVITQALKRYGMILADNGSAWFISGVPDERWDNDHLRDLARVAGADFEAVDTSSLMADPDSGQVAGAMMPTATPTETPTVVPATPTSTSTPDAPSPAIPTSTNTLAAPSPPTVAPPATSFRVYLPRADLRRSIE